MTEQQAPQSGAVDLVGRKVRLTGRLWGTMDSVRRGAVRTVAAEHPGSEDGETYVTLLEQGFVAFHTKPDTSFGAQLLPKRVRIWVYSFAVPDESGGFDWGPVDDDPIGAARLRAMFDEEAANPVGYGALVEFHLALDGAANMTAYIEGELEDAIARGLVGKIIGKY